MMDVDKKTTKDNKVWHEMVEGLDSIEEKQAK